MDAPQPPIARPLSPPRSPGASPAQLKNCVEELLKFTLVLSVQGKLQTGLCTEYCAHLLREDPSNPLPTSSETSKGVPSFPLYKSLASSFYHSICGEAFRTAYKEHMLLHRDQSIKKKYEELNEPIVEKGHALLSLLREVDFELHVQEPFFSQLNDGLKTVEGRCFVGDYKRIQPGNLLLFNKCLTLQVQDVHQYASFHGMLEAESLAKVLPGITCIEEGVQIYRNFYSKEKEMSNGVLAIHLKRPTSQPHVIMASILSGFNYGGVQKLLGFAETTGTNQELLPSPTSTLLSAFMVPHNPDVKGSTLTNGARALAKHVNRSSEEYWGALKGSDSEKNRHALDVITRLITDCSWMNMHNVPPHGVVFEIRSADGYGARWSADGSRFIGFLEPYMVDGHSNSWKH